ncbi:p5 variant B [pistacia virus B]|uniref:P5 variant B n=1 Tax=pistacia virus B TaxID=2848035 RepID=A0A410JAN1_9VIRU|nr:p5 variant B [Pistacia emaravirus]QAR18007.1 p5 variant B [pistacia virus B]
MEHITPYSNFINGKTVKLENKEKIDSYYGPSILERHSFNYIKNQFNECDCFEKDVFYGDCSKLPQNAPISCLEIYDKFPDSMYSIKKVHSKFRFSLTAIDEKLYTIIKSNLYSFIIREFESDKDEINIVITSPMRIMRQFIMVKLYNRELLINEAKLKWKEIISSTTLCGLRSVLSHFQDMRDFYYKIVRNEKYVKSVYSFIDDNKSVINHILPTIETSFKSYNKCVLKYINEHLQEAYHKSDYNLHFDRSKINESCIESESDREDFSVEVSNAIYNDVTMNLKELEIQLSEYDVLKRPCLELVGKKLVPVKYRQKIERKQMLKECEAKFPTEVEEIVEYFPGSNPIEDLFHYGLPNTIELTSKYLHFSMKKNINTEDDIDNIDYISGYPFKESYKKLIFSILKRQNHKIKVSHLFLHYFCLYMYTASVASIRAGVEPAYEREKIEQARIFAKRNLNELRSKLSNYKTLELPEDHCMSFKLNF